MSYGSPATTALSDEKIDEDDVPEVEEDCLSSGSEYVENLQATSSLSLALSNIPDVPNESQPCRYQECSRHP